MGMSGLSPGRTEPTARLKAYKAARRAGLFLVDRLAELAVRESPTVMSSFAWPVATSRASAHRSGCPKATDFIRDGDIAGVVQRLEDTR